MSAPPANPCVYHITHVANLPDILASGGLLSDAAILTAGGPKATIGMGKIKQRRLSLPIPCHPGLNVGDCVPFYFCPRSIMLYVIHCANHPELTYRGGQGPIVHLEIDLGIAVHWANTQGRRWAFSLSNASAGYAQFRNDLAHLGDIDWYAVASNSFGGGSVSPSGAAVREGKQAEFLVEGGLPWALVQRIGVHSTGTAAQVHNALVAASHKPTVQVQPSWYF